MVGRLATALLMTLGFTGCSLVVDPGRHMGGDAAADSGTIDSAVVDSAILDAAEDSRPDGCGIPFDAGGGFDGGLMPLVAADVCASISRVLCESRRCCCSTASETLTTCLTSLTESCEQVIGAVVTSELTGYNADTGASLLRRAEAEGAVCGLGLLDVLGGRAGLLSALDGTGTPAATCPGNAASPFLERALSCGNDHVCRTEMGELIGVTCHDLSATGEFCRTDYDCAAGLRCNTAPTQRRCGNLLPDGSLCDRASECASFLCEDSICAERTVDGVYCSDPFDLLPAPTAD